MSGRSSGENEAPLAPASPDVSGGPDVPTGQINSTQLIAFAGDWHGNKAWALDTIDALADRGIHTIIHCGDFGVWPGRGGRHYARDVNDQLGVRDMTLMLCPGNHEDWDVLDRIQLTGNGIGMLRYGVPQGTPSQIFYLARGARWTWEGIRFAALGGAVSIDREFRRLGGQNRTWWPQEACRPADVERLAAGGPVDVLVCHDRPFAAPLPLQTPSWVPFYLLAESDAHRQLIQQAVNAVQPRVVVHGHYHDYDDHSQDRIVVDMPHGPVLIVGLDRDGTTIARNTWTTTAAELADPAGAGRD